MCLDVTVDSLTAIMAQPHRSSKKFLKRKNVFLLAKKKKKKKKKRPLLILKYGSLLEGLSRLPPRCRQKMIRKSPKEVIDCVGKCCLNIIKGNVRLTNAQKQHLRSRKRHIRLLSKKKGVPIITKKKKIINQKGGALLGLLLPPLLGSVLGGLLHPPR